MPLPQHAINELKAIHKNRTNEDLSDDEAHAIGNRLLQLFAILLDVRAPLEPLKLPDTFTRPGRDVEPLPLPVPSAPPIIQLPIAESPSTPVPIAETWTVSSTHRRFTIW